jgi:phenylacetate-CoA ligase
MIPIVQRNVVLPLIEAIRGEPISRCLTELSKTQWYSRDQLRELQWNKLKTLLRHCHENVPFYRELFAKVQLHPEDIKSFDDFKQLPTLAKDDVRFNTDAITDATSVRKVEHMHTGGTLGIPLVIKRDMLCSAYIRASEARAFEWHGIRRGEKQVRIWGLELDGAAARRDRIKDLLLNRRRIPIFEISEDTVRFYVDLIRRFRPSYIFGLPSAIHRICRIMKGLALDGGELGIRHVACSGESLREFQRETIERTFGCGVINEYGCCEMGPIAMECNEGNMHLTMENILVEFVELGDAPSDHSEIILTNLNNYTMPLLRYRIGDTGRPLTTQCSCGRRSEIMSFDAGRVLDMLVSPDGSYISGALFCYIAFDIIQKHGGIKDFRVVQRMRDRLDISLVKDNDFSDETLALFNARIHEKFGPEMKIEYDFLDEIPLEKSGKRLFVYSKLS